MRNLAYRSFLKVVFNLWCKKTIVNHFKKIRGLVNLSDYKLADTYIEAR